MSIYRCRYERSGSRSMLQRRTAGQPKHPGRETLQLSRLLREAGAQPKLKIGKSNGRYEQEADRVADRVMRLETSAEVAPAATGITPLTVQRAEEEEAQPKLVQKQEEEEEAAQPKLLQRQPLEEEEEELQPLLQRQPMEEEEETLQTKRIGENATAAPANLTTQVLSLRGGGRALPEAERAFFEPRFGVDFSAVRIHTGGRADEVARSINARAFTVGQDLVFGAGQYAPGSPEGRKLLAHELTHVVQQGGGRSGKLQPASDISRGAATSTIQRRRLPKKSDLLPLLTGRNAAAHRAGLARMIRRTMKLLKPTSKVLVKTKARGKLTPAQFSRLPGWQQHLKLVEVLRQRYPQLRYGDPALVEVGARNAAERANLKTLVSKTSGYFKLIAGGRLDRSIKKVFGSSNAQLAAVKANYAKAHRQMKVLYLAGKIKTDRSGYSGEVGLGGYGNDAIIMLSSDCFDKSTAAESILTLLHESVHAGNSKVGDHVYVQSKTTFPKVSEKIKRANAAHYEIPLRRHLKASFSYGTSTFVPAGTGSAALTPLQAGIGLATNRFRQAWDAAVTLHELLMRAYRQPRIWWQRAKPLFDGAHPRSRFGNCLPYWSKVERLTIHQRKAISPSSSNASRKPVSGIDLALSEGVSRRLHLTKASMPRGSVKTEAFLKSKLGVAGYNKIKKNKYKIRDKLLRMVIQHRSGQITGSVVRDMAVVLKLAKANGDTYKGILRPRKPSRFPYA